MYDLGKKDGEECHITTAIPFESARDFNRKDAKIRATISEVLNWGTSDGARTIKVLTLKVDPEDYHADLFSRFYSADNALLEEVERVTIGIGFRTLNLGIISDDGYYDDVRSLSFDGKGTSLFYQWVADEAGVEDWNNYQFISTVNAGANTYRPQGYDEIEISDAIRLARNWYLADISKLIKKHTPAEIDNFLICGGGAINQGKELSRILWGNAMICPESDIANAAGQLIELAIELGQV